MCHAEPSKLINMCQKAGGEFKNTGNIMSRAQGTVYIVLTLNILKSSLYSAPLGGGILSLFAQTIIH